MKQLKIAGPVTSRRLGREFGLQRWLELGYQSKVNEMRGPWTGDQDAAEEAVIQGTQVELFVEPARKEWLTGQRHWRRDDDIGAERSASIQVEIGERTPSPLVA